VDYFVRLSSLNCYFFCRPVSLTAHVKTLPLTWTFELNGKFEKFLIECASWDQIPVFHMTKFKVAHLHALIGVRTWAAAAEPLS
jgi:hypothetical protein